MNAPIEFWSRDPKTSWLSTFADSPFKRLGHEYPTVEHYYQCQKTDNPGAREEIRRAKTPGEAKRLGRSLSLEHRKPQPIRVWKRCVHMAEGMLGRYRAHPKHFDRLVQTGAAPLVHVTPWPGGDDFWGAGENGGGLNLQGEMLQILRDRTPEGLSEWRFVRSLIDALGNRLL